MTHHPSRRRCVAVLLASTITSAAAQVPLGVASGASPPATRQSPTSFRDCPACPEMVVIPAGRFVMGAGPGEEEREQLDQLFRNRSEPQRVVNVGSFAAGKFEVTRAQYRAFTDATRRDSGGCFVWTGADFAMAPARNWRSPGFEQDDMHPVVCVSWDDASAYVKWLSQTTGRKYRLLTEAEWEYAARAGTNSSRYWGDDGNMACAYANGADLTARAKAPGAMGSFFANCSDGYAHTAPVGSYRANAFGLHDMLGNVGEWTQDCWNENYHGAPSDGSAWEAGDCSLRAVRGGSWDDNPLALRAAYRVGSPTVIRLYSRGFRVARDN